MSVPEDERQRQSLVLAQMFGEMPELDRELASLGVGWKIVQTAEGRIRDFELRNGDSRINLRIGEGIFFLKWQAELPDFLRPSPSIEDYIEFRDFIFSKLPAKLFELGSRENYKEQYQHNSDVSIRFRNGRHKTHQLYSEKGRIGLELDYLTRADQIQRLNISAYQFSTRTKPYSFDLAFDYPPETLGGADVLLGLNLVQAAAVNADFTEWVLSTVVHRDALGDLSVSARDLTTQLLPIVQGSIHAK